MVRVDCLKAKALLKLKMRHKDELEGRLKYLDRMSEKGNRRTCKMYKKRRLPHFAMGNLLFSICQMPDQ